MRMTNISLNSGVTMDKFIAFYQNEIIPAYEESLPEVQFYLIKAIRGEEEGNLGVLWIAEIVDNIPFVCKFEDGFDTCKKYRGKWGWGCGY